MTPTLLTAGGWQHRRSPSHRRRRLAMLPALPLPGSVENPGNKAMPGQDSIPARHNEFSQEYLLISNQWCSNDKRDWSASSPLKHTPDPKQMSS
eukprot:4553765-Amphidinium_carterae.2